jgi:hypothetical protein
LFITLADTSGAAAIAIEAIAVGKAVTQAASDGTPEIVKVVAENVKSGTGRRDLPDGSTGDRTETKTALLRAIKTAVRAVETKSPNEVEAYKTWLASVAAKVSQASREGRVLGFGGTVVSREEEQALKQLSDVLGSRPRQTRGSA